MPPPGKEMVGAEAAMEGGREDGVVMEKEEEEEREVDRCRRWCSCWRRAVTGKAMTFVEGGRSRRSSRGGRRRRGRDGETVCMCWVWGGMNGGSGGGKKGGGRWNATMG